MMEKLLLVIEGRLDSIVYGICLLLLAAIVLAAVSSFTLWKTSERLHFSNDLLMRQNAVYSRFVLELNQINNPEVKAVIEKYTQP